jgi:hypothetical protein
MDRRYQVLIFHFIKYLTAAELITGLDLFSTVNGSGFFANLTSEFGS